LSTSSQKLKNAFPKVAKEIDTKVANKREYLENRIKIEYNSVYFF